MSLAQVRDHAKEAMAMVVGRTRADLDRDRMLELCLTRLLEIVGEAAGRVPHEDRDNYPDLPWPMMIGMRNRLIHGYDIVDLDVLWDTIRDHLPPLVSQLDRILGDRPPSKGVTSS